MFQAGGLPVVATCGTALTAAAGAALRRFALEGGALLRPGRRGPGRGRAKLGAAGRARASTSTSSGCPAGEDPDTFIQKRGREAFVGQLKTSKPYLEFLLDRAAAEHDLTRDEPRREFLRKMLAVAARIPDPAARDQFADRLAHKARVTEEVVRAEIRKAAAARKTELPAGACPDAGRPRSGGRAGAAVGRSSHQPSGVLPWIQTLEDDDLEGLSSSALLKMARDLDLADAAEVQTRSWSV